MYIITTCLRVGYSPGLAHFKKCKLYSELCCSYNSASKVHCSWLQYVTPSFYMECLLFSLWFHEQDLNHLIPLAGSSFMPAYIHYNTQWRIVTGGLGDTTPRNGSALPTQGLIPSSYAVSLSLSPVTVTKPTWDKTKRSQSQTTQLGQRLSKLVRVEWRHPTIRPLAHSSKSKKKF